jgi:hypothetical protein
MFANVKRLVAGETGLRWTAAGMLEAEKQFRKVIGYTPPASGGHDRTPTPLSPAQPRNDPGGRDRSHYVTTTTGPSSTKFHDRRGNLSAVASSVSSSGLELAAALASCAIQQFIPDQVTSHCQSHGR